MSQIDLEFPTLEDTLYDVISFALRNNMDTIPITDEKNVLVGSLSKKKILEQLNFTNDLSIKIKNLDIERCNKRNCIMEEDNMDFFLQDNKSGQVFVLNENNKIMGVISESEYLKSKIRFFIQSFDSIINSFNHGIIVIDKNLNITVFNNIAGEILGIDSNEAIGRKIKAVFSQTKLPNTLQTGKSYENDLVEIRDRKILTTRTPLVQDGKIIGAVALFQDVTEHDNLLKKLEEQKNISQVLNTILETAYDGIVVVDKEGYITMLSKAYSKFLGVNEEEVIGKHVTQVIENTRMHVVAKTGVPEIADMQRIKGDYMIASRIPIIKNGGIVGVVGKVLFRNIEEFNDLYKKIGLMEKELEQYKGELMRMNEAKYSFDSIIGKSRRLLKTKQLARRAALTDSNVLLIGESGTGKELFAHAIHNASNRRFGPFVKVNCAAIPAELLESELFGYEEGAFTGAKRGGKIGKFELADGGTIFLDEIGDMPLSMQAKLLRVIQEKEVERIGGNGSKRVNVRIIAATNKNLEEMVENDEYREDLYYRLNVFTINIPALRERPEDIPLLSNYFLNELCQKYHKKIEKISEGVLKYLVKYNWPGNVRELANTIEWCINMIDKEETIEIKHIPKRIIDVNYIDDVKNLKETLEEAEREAIIESLRVSGGNKSKAAKLLGIGRTTLYEKLEKYNIDNA